MQSPPPLFLSRKGTRSRPNVKIPKYYHTHYERISESTIVREPHTEQPDPLFQLDEIKSEPLDLDDDVIEIEDNVIGFTNVPEIPPHDEEIFGNYDSPLVNLNDKADKEKEHTPFKKINLVAQPIIMDVHSIAEKSPSTLQVIDLSHLKEKAEKSDDPLEAITDTEGNKTTEDPFNFINESTEKGTNSITITNVQSMAGMEETEEKRNDIAIDDATKEQVTTEEKAPSEANCVFRIENVMSEKEDVGGIEKLDEFDEVHFDVTENESCSQETVDLIQPEISFNDKKENDETSVAKDVPNSELSHDVNQKRNESNIIEETQTATTTKEKEEVTDTETDKEKIDSNITSSPVKENSVELDFHIAEVASEQFFATEKGENDIKDVISEDCASELGFQITNVVSGQIEGLDQMTSEDSSPKDAGSSDPGTFLNHLEQIENATPKKPDDGIETTSTLPVAGELLSEETQFLADSLEELLDK